MQDSLRPIQPSRAEHGLMVSEPPAPVAQRAAAKVERKTTRSLRVLWRNRELGGVVAVPPRSRVSLAEVALSPQLPWLAAVEPVPTPAHAVSASSRVHAAFNLQMRSEPVIRGTVCSNASTY